MNRIVQLSSHLADLIAAGEVVERPASVIKELFENSVDAGATSVTVEIKSGGLELIRVTDNGSGIAADDVPLAFLRHATSKISTATDLESISTLGFRGEALAAISSVSRIELETATEGAEGVRITLEGGDVTLIEPSGRPRGTTITVRDLFYNTPARQKFVKTDRAESSAALQTMIRLALSRPDVAVRYVRDGSEELRTHGDGNAEACVYSVLGRETATDLVSFATEHDGVVARGFVSKVEALRGNRNQQFFFVNGRSIKSKTLQAALEQAYRNRQFTGRFPACVIYIEVGAARLDVNVHPSKTEIKFLFEKHVFDAVHYGSKTALDGALGITSIPVSTPAPMLADVPPLPKRTPSAPPTHVSDEPFITTPNVTTGYSNSYRKPAIIPILPVREPDIFPYGNSAAPVPQIEIASEPDIAIEAEIEIPPAPPNEDVQEHIKKPATPEFRLIGEALRTYIIVESDERLWLIDKHAAHERIHFDRLRSAAYEPMPQALLDPIIISPQDPATLLDSADMLESLGFSVDDFGNGNIAVRQIPSDIEAWDTEGVLSDISRELSRGGDTSARRDEILASVACKAAIKSGKNLTERELSALAARVMSGEVRHCPHGRPVSFEMTKTFIDKNFLRI